MNARSARHTERRCAGGSSRSKSMVVGKRLDFGMVWASITLERLF
jgi:hypothetical protein